ncbi:MAG: hypothetical protein Q9166_005201 [cf. Caloplaca sp. 2 TL-2023]
MLPSLRWISSVLWRGNGSTRTRLLPPVKPLKEEPIERYCPGRYHPVKLGDVFGNRYKVVRKLGWGLYSTVWLARDAHIGRHVALKILVADAFGFYDEKKQWHSQPRTFENEILQDIDSVHSDHPGRKHIPKLLDEFEHTGPHGTHVCLIFQLMGRTLDTFSAQWRPPRVPSPIMRRAVKQLLSALDFLHRICGVIHTVPTIDGISTDCSIDLKPSNILLDLSTTEPESQKTDWLQYYFDSVPVPTGISHPDFDYVQSMPIFAPVTDASMINIQLADFGTACWEKKHLAEAIQPELLRAPEVIFQLPWSAAVDIWSAGVIIYELMVAKRLFGGNTLNNHLEQMVALLGPFPSEFMNRVHGHEQYFTPDGHIRNAARYKQITFEDALSESPLSEEEKRDFLAFLRSMLNYLPEERKTAQELLGDPWLHKDYECQEYESR